MSERQKYIELIDNGYCVLEDIYSSELISRMRDVTDQLVDEMSEEEAQRQRSTGSLISVMKHEGLVDLICDPGALRALESIGLTDMQFQSGYVISKPPQGPPLFWHFDWGGWSHPISFEKVPVQLFLMIYLTDTSRENGCLRVLPGSHLRENSLHRDLADAHSEELTEARDLSRVEYQPRPDEVDVCVRAGDLVVGDSRILHAAHGNQTQNRRTVVTLWFHPFASRLPEPIKAYCSTRIDPIPEEWSLENQRRVKDLLITCDPNAEPVPFSREFLREKDAVKE